MSQLGYNDELQKTSDSGALFFFGLRCDAGAALGRGRQANGRPGVARGAAAVLDRLRMPVSLSQRRKRQSAVRGLAGAHALPATVCRRRRSPR